MSALPRLRSPAPADGIIRGDGCTVPGCQRKNVPGNENIIDGRLVCDDCHAAMRSPAPAEDGHRNGNSAVNVGTPLINRNPSADLLELEPMSVIERKVEDLVVKAAEAYEAHVAMQYAQAALNAAHAAQVLSIIEREKK